MEIDARNGVIVRLGGKHGIAAPMNALMVALLEAAQRLTRSLRHQVRWMNLAGYRAESL